jgi:hypothetical protein
MQIAGRRHAVGDEPDADEPIRILIWQIAQQNTVNDRADADRGADADPERRDHSCRESWSAMQAAESETRVAREIVDRDDPARVSRLFAEALCASEAEQGGASRFVSAHPAADVLRRFHFYVKRELFALLGGVSRPTPEQLSSASQCRA